MALQHIRGSLIVDQSIATAKLQDAAVTGIKLADSAKEAVLRYKPIIVGVTIDDASAPAVGVSTFTFQAQVGPSENGEDGIVDVIAEPVANANVEILSKDGAQIIGQNGRALWGRVTSVAGSAAPYTVTVEVYDAADKTLEAPAPYVWTGAEPVLLDAIYPVRKNLFSMSETDLTKNTFRNFTAVERDIVTVNELDRLFAQSGILRNASLDVAATNYLTATDDLLEALKVLDTQLAAVSGGAGGAGEDAAELYAKTGVVKGAANTFSSEVYVASGDTLKVAIGKLDASLDTEVKRATAAEAGLQSDIDAEVARATAAEGVLRTDLDAEIARATGAEAQLRTDLNAEIARATGAEAGLQSDIDAEVARATGAEAQLRTDLDSEVARATAAEGVLRTDLNTEVARATAAEADLQAQIDALESGSNDSVADLYAKTGVASGAANTFSSEVYVASGDTLKAAIGKLDAALKIEADNLSAHVADNLDPHGVTLTQSNLIIAASGVVSASATVDVQNAAVVNLLSGAKLVAAGGSIVELSGTTIVKSNVSVDTGVTIDGIDLDLHAHDGTASGGAKISAANVLFTSASGIVATAVAPALDELKGDIEEVRTTGGDAGLPKTEEFVVTAATQSAFALAFAPKVANEIKVTVGGIRVSRLDKDGNANWSVAGSTVTFSGADATSLPNQGDIVIVDYHR